MPWVIGFFGYMVSLGLVYAEIHKFPNETMGHYALFLLLGFVILVAVFFGSFTYKYRGMPWIQRLQKSFDYGGASLAVIALLLHFFT